MGQRARQHIHVPTLDLRAVAARVLAARFGDGAEGLACGQGLLVETAALPEGLDGVLLGDVVSVRADAHRRAVVLALVAVCVLRDDATTARALALLLDDES